MSFTSKSRRPPSALMSTVRRHPFMFFGLPFLSIVVVSSFALKTFTQTRYDLNDQKVQAVSKEDELGMSKERKKVDIREEYYRLNAPASSLSSNDEALAAVTSAPAPPKKKFSLAPTSNDDYEPIRVPRPAGVSEWGGVRGASPDAPIKGQRKEDRWV
ncbi:Cytochrome c oxidase assembly protein COX16, mitochondrial [Vanrija pseudolonga]|uniref:Cytochrome c oxidase assembly protein COX16, mitochondrial n=1 Tax=Vanrija pseudolonga TaxID=143232 RepID=A0AAF0Y666_9TREE|nr:Cytochrome c oxidase assembly protein COX16, mitochondrial [Vanrija pseudolonga]